MGEALKARLKQNRFENPLQEALLNLMVASGHIHEFLEKTCAPFGITHVQYNLLRILRGVHPKGHPRCEIARRMIERSPDVTRLIDRLEKQGLVERIPSEKDRRLSVTRITPKGLQLIKKLPIEQGLQRYFSERISLRDRRELSRICEGLYESEIIPDADK